jgi:hypothetical protein
MSEIAVPNRKLQLLGISAYPASCSMHLTLSDGCDYTPSTTSVSYTCAATTTYGFGKNDGAQCGDTVTITNRIAPTVIPNLATVASGVNIVDLTVGGNSIIVLGSNGKLYGWGINSNG